MNRRDGRVEYIAWRVGGRGMLMSSSRVFGRKTCCYVYGGWEGLTLSCAQDGCEGHQYFECRCSGGDEKGVLDDWDGHQVVVCRVSRRTLKCHVCRVDGRITKFFNKM